jgi:hypothetical protein
MTQRSVGQTPTRRCHRHSFPTGPSMIIVSDPSAEATQPVRTGQYTPAHRRSSPARDDIVRYADARPISVHTEEHNCRSEIDHASGGPCSGMAPTLGAIEVGHQGDAGIPSRRRATRFGPTFHASRTTTVVLSTCCNERSITVNCGTGHPPAGQRQPPGRINRLPGSRRGSIPVTHSITKARVKERPLSAGPCH